VLVIGYEKRDLVCDSCGKEQPDAIVKSYRINQGREMDPSGNGYNTNWHYTDLCITCIKAIQAHFGDKVELA
jgi:hypothetical protein